MTEARARCGAAHALAGQPPAKLAANKVTPTTTKAVAEKNPKRRPEV